VRAGVFRISISRDAVSIALNAARTPRRSRDERDDGAIRFLPGIDVEEPRAFGVLDRGRDGVDHNGVSSLAEIRTHSTSLIP